MSEALRVFLAIFACYRLVELLTFDFGPFDCFERLRRWAGCDQHGDDGRPVSFLGRLLACPYCVGIWAALLCALLVLLRIDVVLLVLGVAGAQAAIHRRFEQ